MKALLLIDIQNDFLPGGTLAVPRGDEVVAVANRLMPQYDLVVATQDWHPPEHKSFASQHAGRGVGDVVQLHGLDQTLWPDHCVQGTRGAELAAELDHEQIDHTIRKGTDAAIDSYSAFFDNARRKSTGLADLLRSKGVDEVHLVGLATDYCVKATALDAIDEGFCVTVLNDGVRGVDLKRGDCERALHEMQRTGVRVATSDEFHETTLFAGRHLTLLARGRWEFVTRHVRRPAVGIVALTDDGCVVLVEQYRPPVVERVVELPAGLTGDVAGSEDESLVDSAKRELREETGYEAARWTELCSGYSSPGLTDEMIVLFLAEGLTKRGPGGGDANENITLHEVPRREVLLWLTERGARADLKLLAGLHAAEQHLQQRGG
jgi:nicotinamidase/pyrazinamidase